MQYEHRWKQEMKVLQLQVFQSSSVKPLSLLKPYLQLSLTQEKKNLNCARQILHSFTEMDVVNQEPLSAEAIHRVSSNSAWWARTYHQRNIWHFWQNQLSERAVHWFSPGRCWLQSILGNLSLLYQKVEFDTHIYHHLSVHHQKLCTTWGNRGKIYS